jgi:hypothetical protein
VTPGSYDLHASGDRTGEVTNTGITVAQQGPDPCLAVCLALKPSSSQTKSSIRLKAIVFQGALPVDSKGNPMPVTLAGVAAATFTVGGPLPSPNLKPRVTLKPEGAEIGSSEVPGSPIEVQGARWSRTYHNVQDGRYLLTVQAGSAPANTLRIVIQADVPGEKRG